MKLTCLINGHGRSLDEFRVLNYFSTKYATCTPFKERMQEPISKYKFGKKQALNDMVQHSFNEIILGKKFKSILSVKSETNENIYDNVDENELYKIDKLSLNEKKWRKHAFESELKNINYMKRLNSMNNTHNKEVNNIAEFNLLYNIKP